MTPLLALELTATGPCLSQAELEQRMPDHGVAVASELRVHITGDSERSLALTIARADEPALASRTFSADTSDCDAFNDALALSLALSLDALGPSGPTRSDKPARVAAPVPPGRGPSSLRLALGSTLLGGSNEPVTGGARLGVGYRLGSAELWGGLDASWPVSSSLGAGSFTQHTISTFARLCYQPGAARWSLGACAGADVGARFARGYGYAAGDGDAAPWAALSAGPLLLYQATNRLGALLSLDGSWAFARPRFDVVSQQGQRTQSRDSAALLWRLGLGLSYRLGD